MPTVVSTSFPDLLAAEEARLNRDDYPPEVTVSNEDNEEADGLLDELLNDDNDSLTNSTDDGSEETDLSELLSETPPDASKPKSLAFVSDNTSQTASEHSSEHFEEALENDSVESKSNARATSQESGMFEADTEVHHNKHDEESDDNDGSYEDEEEDDDSAASSDTHGTQDLLEKAHDRLNMQNLFEEVGRLRLTIEKKDKEMEEMAGQLRRAVATKCDLVIAHTELERHHSFNLKQLEAASRQLLKANFGLVEEQADTDVQLMNEIVRLNMKLEEQKTTHIQELGDWERLHAAEIRAKDLEIDQLREEIRKLTMGTTIGRKQKQRLGLARQ